MIAGELEQQLRRLVREEVRAALAESSGGPIAKHLTVKAYAAARSIAESTVRAAIREGRLPSIRIGRAVRVPADAAIGPSASRANEATARAERALGIMRGGAR